MNLFVNSTNRIEIAGIANQDTEAFINNATVTLTIVDDAGANVTGATSLAMTYVTDSDGVYRVVVPATAALVAGDKYTLRILVVASGVGQLDLRTEKPITAKYKPITLT